MMQIEFRKELSQYSGKPKLKAIISIFKREINYYIQSKHKVHKPILKPVYKLLYDEERQTEYISITWYADAQDSAFKNKIIWLNDANPKPKLKKNTGNNQRRCRYA